MRKRGLGHARSRARWHHTGWRPRRRAPAGAPRMSGLEPFSWLRVWLRVMRPVSVFGRLSGSFLLGLPRPVRTTRWRVRCPGGAGSAPGRFRRGPRACPHRRIAVPIPLFSGVDALIHVSLAHGRRGDIARIDTDRDPMDCPPMSTDTVSLSGTQLSLLVRVRDVADGRTERRPAPE